MILKRIIKHHRYEAEHAKRLGALVAADLHINAAEALEDIESRFGEVIVTATEASEWVLIPLPDQLESRLIRSNRVQR